jgi:rubrerythrin
LAEILLIDAPALANGQRVYKDINKLPYPVLRCLICGYVCARDEAPEVCPICGASHDRFEKFI